MIIERLDLKAFGRFCGTSLDLSAAPHRFHLVYGPNESGKSTSLRAILSLLFGMPHVSEDNYLHANAQIRVGGLLVDEAGNRLECVRRRGRKGTLRDGDDAEPIDESELRKFLGNVDRETFTVRFGLSHDELSRGGKAILEGEGDLGQLLFAAGAGVSHLRNVDEALQQDSKQLFSPRGTKTINTALTELDELRKNLRAAQVPPLEYASLETTIAARRKDRQALNDQLQRVVVELARLKAYQQALPLMPSWRSHLRDLAALAETPSLDEDFTQRRRKVEAEIEVASQREEEVDKRLQEVSGRLDALTADPQIVAHETEVQNLFQELAARDKADQDRLDLIRVQGNVDRKITELLRELSVELDPEDQAPDAMDVAVQRLRVSDAQRARLQELAGKHQRLVQQADDATAEVTALEKRLEELDRDFERIDGAVDPTSLSQVIESVGPPAALLESAAEQQESFEQLERRCETLCRKLGGFGHDYRGAAAIRPPERAAIERLEEQIGRATEARSTAHEQLEQLTADQETLQQEIEGRRSETPLPTAESLARSRADRDRLVEQLAQRIDSGTAASSDVDAIRTQIRESDAVADLLQKHGREVHHRAEQAERLGTLERRCGAAQKTVTACEQRLQTILGAWKALWGSCEVSAEKPEAMRDWLSHHGQLVQAVDDLDELHKRIEQSQRRIERGATRLRAALGSVASSKVVPVKASLTQGALFEEDRTDDLVSLYDEAVALRADLTRTHQQYATLRERRAELANQLPRARARLETRSRDVEMWTRDWQRATESLGVQESSPTVVMSTVRRIDELCEKKRERDILATRIRSIQDDEQKFQVRVNRLAKLAACPTSDEPGPLIQTLYQRLQRERTALQQRALLQEQRDSGRQQLEAISRARRENEVALRQLCREAHCDHHRQLPDVERRARQQRELQAALRELENQFLLLAGNECLDDFFAALEGQEPALLDLQITQQEAALAELRNEISTADQEIGALSHQWSGMNGGGAAAELLQSMQSSLARIESESEQFARLKVASMILRRAIERYRRENQSPVLAIAERYFRQLTCGEYQALRVDYDSRGKSVLFGIRATGQPNDVPAPAMSTGTADSLYLALRLATLQHQLDHGVKLPLIVDDCLVQLDNARSVATLQALSELSKTTQVILFTHHEHLLDLARTSLDEQAFHVHRLSP